MQEAPQFAPELLGTQAACADGSETCLASGVRTDILRPGTMAGQVDPTIEVPFPRSLVTYLKAATRAACSRITRALSSSAVPAGSPLTLTNGLDHTGRRGQPPQLSL
jgi:hypothetical protein